MHSSTNFKISGSTAPLQLPQMAATGGPVAATTIAKSVDFSAQPSMTEAPQDQIATSGLSQGSAKVQSFAMEESVSFPELRPAVSQNLQLLEKTPFAHTHLRDVVRTLQSLVLKNPQASGAEIANLLQAALKDSPQESQTLAQALLLKGLEPADLDQLCQQLENKLQGSSGHHQAEDRPAVDFAVDVLKNNITYNAEEIASLLKALQGLVLNAHINSWTAQELQSEVQALIAHLSPAAQSFANMIELESMNLNTLSLLGSQTQDLKAAIERVQNLDAMGRIEQRQDNFALRPSLKLEQEVNLTTGESQAIMEVKAPDSKQINAVETQNAALTQKIKAQKYGTLLAQAAPTSLDAKDKGLAGLMHLLNRSGSDTQQFLQAVLSGKDPKSIKIDFKKGQNYILAHILGMNNETQANALIQTLQKFQMGGVLSTEELKSLEDAGIKIKEGVAYNLANRQALTSSELETIAQVAQHMLVRGLAGDSESVQNMKSLLPQIVSAFQSIEEIQTMGETINKNKDQIERQTEELAITNQAVADAQSAVERSEGRAQTAQSDFDKAQALLRQIRTQGFAFLLQKAREGGLLDINRLLSELDISIDVQGDQVVISHAGKRLSEGEFQQKIEAWVNQKTDNLIQARNQLKKDSDELTKWQTKANEMAKNLEKLVNTQADLIANQRAKLRELREKILPELAALKADPAQWAQLSEQEKALVEQLLQAGPQILAEEEALVEAAEHTNTQARSFIAQTTSLNEGTQNILASNNKTLNSIDKTLESQLGEETQALIAHANELEQTLSLAPRPANLNTAKMTEEWLRSLEKLEAQLKQQTKQEAQNDEIERQFSGQNAQKSLRRLEYHIKQLKALDLHQTERIDQMLKSSVQRTSKELSALLIPKRAV